MLCSVFFLSWYCTCRIEENWLWRIESKLQFNLFGQSQAIDVILKKLVLHDFDSPSDENTILLFIGDNGVGKTRTTHLISEGLYGTKSNTPFLYINHIEYQTTSNEIRLELKKLILDKIELCPKSLIVIDFFEQFHPENREVVVKILGSTKLFYKGNVISISQSIFIFISDFAGDVSPKNVQEIRNSIYKRAEDIYSPIPEYHDKIVPFFPLTEAASKDYIRYLFETFKKELTLNGKLFISSSSFNNLVNIILNIYRKSLRFKSTNYRGISEIFEEQFSIQLLKFIQQNPVQSVDFIGVNFEQETLSFTTTRKTWGEL